jgi:hypothetical protein
MFNLTIHGILFAGLVFVVDWLSKFVFLIVMEVWLYILVCKFWYSYMLLVQLFGTVGQATLSSTRMN